MDQMCTTTRDLSSIALQNLLKYDLSFFFNRLKYVRRVLSSIGGNCVAYSSVCALGSITITIYISHYNVLNRLLSENGNS